MRRIAALTIAGALAVGGVVAVPVAANAAPIDTTVETVETTASPSPSPTETTPAETATPSPSATEDAVEETTVTAVEETEPAELPAVETAKPAPPAPSTTDIVVSARVISQLSPTPNLFDSSYLEGVAFELFEPAASGGPGEATGYGCEFGAGDLDCTISVPDTAAGGENAGDQFYVVMTDAGASATAIPELMTGTSSEPDTLRYYAGLTPALNAGETIAYPQQGSGQTLNSQVVAASLDNPVLAPSCLTGDRLALKGVMDLSGSVSAAQRDQYRVAFEGLVADLAGERVDLYLSTFGTSSPVDGRAGGPWSLDDASDVEDALNAITSFTKAVPGATQQTNWDLALRNTANYPGLIDALVMITDGAPNFISNAAGNGGQPVAGSQVTIASIEQAVFSANALKAGGTRVIAMGVGNGVSGPVYRNLAAISGPVAGSDYFQGDWSTLADDLKSAVTPLVCRTPVTATTYVVDADGENPVATDGFTVGSEVTEVAGGQAALVGENPQVTGSDDNPTGEANWTVRYDDLSASATLTVTQDELPEYSIVGVEWSVTDLDGTVTTGASESGTAVIPGVEATDSVDVDFYNIPDLAPASFGIRKVITGDGAHHVPGDTQFLVDYTVNGEPAAEPLAISANGTVTASPTLEVGDEIAFTERAPAAIAGITWGATPVIAPITVTEKPIVVEVTNSATLQAASFQVRKSVVGNGAGEVPSGTSFTLDYTVNGVAAATPLRVTASGDVVNAPELKHGDVIRISENSLLPSVSGITWGAVPQPQTITLAAGTTPVVTFTNTATLVGSLPVTGADFTASAVIGVGAFALLAGTVLVLMTRRRARQS